MDTEDQYDFSFSPVRPKDSGADKMTIAEGRAMLGFNRSTSADYFIRGPVGSDLEVTIFAGALSLAAVATSIAAVLAF